MLGVLKTIFGSGTIVEKGLELIDESFESAEELTENKTKIIEAKTSAKTALLQAYAPFKITQRYLALIMTVMYAFILANGILGSLYGWIDLENVKNALEFANTMWLGEITLTIYGFYFGGGFIESIGKSKTKERIDG